MALRDVIGQDRSVGILLQTLGRGRVPSAYLFSGESGIGKKFAAVNFAKAINCLKPVDSQQSSVIGRRNGAESIDGVQSVDYRLIDSCDECPSCRKIESGAHPDFLMITPEKGEIRVSEIRAVEEALSFKPYEGRKKVVVIDDADSMNQSAANAFLKTLEEPPVDSLLILVAAHADRLPETIRSRCSRVNFTPLSPDACEKVIQSVAGQPAGPDKKRSDGADEVQVMVRLSMGRPGLAVSADIVGERERFISLLESMIGVCGETWTDKEEMERWLDLILIMLRDMTVLKVAGKDFQNKASRAKAGSGMTLFNSDIRDYVLQVSKASEIDGMVEAYRKLVLLRARLDFNLNKGVTWNYVSGMMRNLRFRVPAGRAG